MTAAQICCLIMSYVFCFASGGVGFNYFEDSKEAFFFWVLVILACVCAAGAFA